MAEIATYVCWGVVIAVWLAGAAYGLRRARGHREADGYDAVARIGSAAAAVLVYRLARPELHRVVDHSWWIELPGLVLLVASTGFTVWARLALGQMWSASPGTLQAHHELRTDGPYAVTRHPIYTGLLGMIVGSVLLNGLGAWLVLLLGAAGVLLARIPLEERLMSRTFPAEYARYRERVPRLVPGLPRLRRSH